MRLKIIIFVCLLFLFEYVVAQDTLVLVGFRHTEEPTPDGLSIKTSWNKTIYNEFGQKRYYLTYQSQNDSTIIKEWIYDEQHRLDTFFHFWNNERIDTTTLQYFDKFVKISGSWDVVKGETVWTLDGKIVSAKSDRYKTKFQKELETSYATEVTFDSLENCECQKLTSLFISDEYSKARAFDGELNFEYCNWYNPEGLITKKKHHNLFSLPGYTFFKYDSMDREIEKISIFKGDTSYLYTSYTTNGDSLYEKSYRQHHGEYTLKVYLKTKVDRGPCYYTVFHTSGDRKLKVEYEYDHSGYVIQSKTIRKPNMIYDEYLGFIEDPLTPTLTITTYLYQSIQKSTFIPQKAYEPE